MSESIVEVSQYTDLFSLICYASIAHYNISNKLCYLKHACRHSSKVISTTFTTIRIHVHMTILFYDVATVYMDLHSDGYSAESESILFLTECNIRIFL